MITRITATRRSTGFAGETLRALSSTLLLLGFGFFGFFGFAIRFLLTLCHSCPLLCGGRGILTSD